MEWFTEAGYIGLFCAAFLAATLLPMGSELILAALLLTGLEPVWLVLVATGGNVLGSLVNYGLGWLANDEQLQRWLRLPPEQLQRARRQFSRYGVWSLLLAWLPVVGDPLTLAAGLMRVSLWRFMLLVSTGKGLRYVLVAFTTLQAAA